MSTYVVLARKWRPSQFSDIVGQTHIVRTLMNAVRSQRVHHAYLLTGSRGIGKTSIARIFAKALRCEAAQAGEDGFLKSCDHCSSCREISTSTSVDVIEIDGASNNGVDSVREIRENAKFLPATGSRKIYIIDEVHMLTTAAFNALLKTLEEPPPHVLFLLATTEPHKIPGTILSRCQRFDLKRVTSQQIQTRLAQVLAAENVEAEPAALALIARAAEGGMRDALSLLDQTLVYAGGKITAAAARDSVGLVSSQAVLSILRGILSRQPRMALNVLRQAHRDGQDMRVLARALVETLHALLLVKVDALEDEASAGQSELTDEERRELQELAALREIGEIELIFQAFHHGVEWLARAPQPRIVLDVLVIKCATAERLIPLAHAGTPSQAGGGTGTSLPPRPQAARMAPAPASAAAPAQQHRAETVAPPKTYLERKAAGATAPAVQTAAPEVAPAANDADELLRAWTAPPAATASKTAASTAAASAAPALLGRNAAGWKVEPARRWEQFVDVVRIARPLLASILEHARPGGAAFTPNAAGELELLFETADTYYRDQVQSRVYSEQLVALGSEYFGEAIRFRVELRDGEPAAAGAPAGETIAARKERVHREREDAARDAARNHPILAEARSLFGGDMGPIELIPEKNTEGGVPHAH